MVQYINKDHVVAEIKRYKHKADERLKIKGRSLAEERKDSALQNLCGNLLYFIDTIEVKEVDLEKEAELIANGIMISVQANKYNTVVYNTKRNDFNHSHLMLAARKGIELGLKAVQKGEEI